MSNFEARQTSINEILSYNYTYIIPKNQRKYIWNEHEWGELFEDLFLARGKGLKSLFLGTIVLQTGNKRAKELIIIDGQQRLITISILLAALTNQLYRTGKNKDADNIRKTFLWNDVKEYSKIRRADGIFFLPHLIDLVKEYKTNQDIEDFYGIHFNQKDYYNKKLKDCFIFFNDLFQGSHISDSLNKIIDSEIIMVRVEKDVDGFRIFETLNARGIPLEQHELLKNFIYRYSTTQIKQERVMKVWDEISTNLNDNDDSLFPRFLTHYCTHRYKKYQKNKQYKTICENTKHNEVDKLLADLRKHSEYYKYIINPEEYKKCEDYNPQVYSALRFFKQMNIIQVRPLILAIFDCYSQGKIKNRELGKYLKTLEDFYFLYVIIASRPTNIINSTIETFAYELCSSNKFELEALTKALSKFIPSYDALSEAFTHIGTSNKNKAYKSTANKRTVQYIFEKIEGSLTSNPDFEFSYYSTEHIANDSDEENWRCEIGDLLPLPIKRNQKAKDKDFDEKLDTYKTVPYACIKKFLKNYGDKTSFTKRAAGSRGKRLAEYGLKEIWTSFRLDIDDSK